MFQNKNITYLSKKGKHVEASNEPMSFTVSVIQERAMDLHARELEREEMEALGVQSLQFKTGKKDNLG